MTIFSDLDNLINEFRHKRDSFDKFSWNYHYLCIKICALQELRKRSLGNYLPDKDGKIVFYTLTPKSKCEFEVRIVDEEV